MPQKLFSEELYCLTPSAIVIHLSCCNKHSISLFMVLYMLKKILGTSFTVRFAEPQLVRLAYDMVD